MMSSSTEDYPNDCDNDRLLEIALSATKTCILLFPVVGHRRNRPSLFLRCGRGRKPQICHWNFNDICHTVRDMNTSGLMAILLFPVIRQCSIYLWTHSLSLAWSITLFTALELQ